MSDWGKGAANNQIGWGQAAGNATNGYGEFQKVSYAGVTDIVGLIALSISYSSNNYCDDSGNTPQPTVTNNAGAGTFSSTTGLVIDSSTGVINTTTSTVGSYLITYTDTDAATATATVVILNLDNASFAYSASSYEPTDANPTPTITGLTGGTFSGSTGLVINSTTGEIDLSASTEASHTVTYNTSTSGSSVCPNTSTFAVTIAVAGISNVYSMSFDGVADKIETYFTPPLSNNSRSISLWFYTSNSSSHNMCGYGAASQVSGHNGFDILTYTGNYVGIHLFGTAIIAGGTYNLNAWNHYVITYDGTTLQGYLNGVAVDSNNTEVVNTLSTNDFIIGEGVYTGFNGFSGKIDEVGIWNTNLSAPQVSEIYNATSTGKTADLSTISGSNLKYWNRLGD